MNRIASSLALVATLSIVTFALGCEQERDKPPQPVAQRVAAAPAPSSAVESAVRPAIEPNAEPTVTHPEVPSVAGVPDPAFAIIELHMVEVVSKRYKKGVSEHRAQKYWGAIAQFLKALEYDPDHVQARYALAKSYSILGKRDEALAVLGQLRALGCVECLRLLDEGRDADEWRTIRKLPAYEALMQSVTPIEADYAEDALTLAADLARGDRSSLRASVAAGHRVTVKLRPRSNERIHVDGPESFGDLDHALKRIPRSGYEIPTSASCKDACCRLSYDGCDTTKLRVTRACFFGESAEIARVVRIDVSACTQAEFEEDWEEEDEYEGCRH